MKRVDRLFAHVVVALLVTCFAVGCSTKSTTIPPPAGHLIVVDRLPFPSVVSVFGKLDNGNIAPQSTLSNTNFVEMKQVAHDAAGNFYVGGNNGTCVGTIMVFAPGSTGATAPTRTISGAANTTLDDSINGIAVDSGSNVYVSQDDNTTDGCIPSFSHTAQISVFGPTATGDVAPLRTIVGAATTLLEPTQLAFDTGGNLWVANIIIDESTPPESSTVLEFGSGVSGNVAPLKTLTGVAEASGVAIDAAGNVYVVDSDTSGSVGPTRTPAILVYPSGATTPDATKTITGSATKLCGTNGIIIDSVNIYVANGEVGSLDSCHDPNFVGILVFNITDNGNVAPSRVIAGSNTGFGQPLGLSF